MNELETHDGNDEKQLFRPQNHPRLPLTSKKEMGIRRKELLEVVSPLLLEHLRDNAGTMVMDKATSVTVSDILASACGDLRPAMTAVAQMANQELVPGGISGQVVNLPALVP